MEELDLAGETCPMNYVRTKLRLETMRPGEVLAVVLDPGEGVRNVPRSAREDGHEVESVEEVDGRFRVIVRRAEEG